MINNQGIVASDNAVVSGNALASGVGTHAAVVGTTPASTDRIANLLRQFVEEVSSSGHADRAELAATAEEACQELSEPAPRWARLKILASGLASAVRGTGALAALAVQIEQAIHGLWRPRTGSELMQEQKHMMSERNGAARCKPSRGIN